MEAELLASRYFKGTQDAKYPTGWYWASFGEDLRKGQVKPVEFMGRHFALFRAKNGTVGLMDAQCCHMGADLGHGGKVVGDRLVCGYHGWEFNTDGKCEHMPLVEERHMTSRACQPTLPVVERAGNIWFWYGSSTPTKEFPDVSYFNNRKEFLTFKGEVHLGHSDPLPIMEHVSDVYHFQHNHGTTEPMEYVITRDEGDTFEYKLRPQVGSAQRSKVQAFFKPYAFVELAGPCSGIYRTQLSDETNRRTPMLTVITGVTPVREGYTLWTWRVIVRRPIRLGPIGYLFDYLFGRIIWALIRKNVHIDVEAINWLNPNKGIERELFNGVRLPERVWVKPDGMSVREYQKFYYRNIEGSKSDVSISRHAPVKEGQGIDDESEIRADFEVEDRPLVGQLD